MKQETRRRKWRWLKHAAWVFSVIIVLSISAVVVFFGSGAGNPLLRRLAVRQLEAMTGGKVGFQSLSIRWLSLRATIKGIVIHGKEPEGTEPLFTAEEIDAGLRIDSYWGRKISLDDLVVKKPHVHIRVETDGSTNVPSPPRPKANKPLRQTLFDLQVRHVQLEDGWILYNDVKKPLVVQGDNMRLALDAGGSPDQALYLGTLDWKSVQLAEGRNVPIPMSIAARFTLQREGFRLEQAQITAGRSRFDVQAEMTDFAAPQWQYRYRGWVNFLDFRQTLRSPHTPEGKVDVRGEGGFAAGQVRGTGSFVASDVNLKYDIFHAAGLGGRGSYRFDNQGLIIPDLSAGAFGGSVRGRVTLRFAGMQFRAETHIEGVRIAQVFPAAEHQGFPIDKLHWDSELTADTVETWTDSFKHFELSGTSQWTAAREMAPGHVPVTASWKLRYQHDPERITIDSATFETATSRIQAKGLLERSDSNLEVSFETGALERYGDFINAIQGIASGSPDERAVRGSARWEGKITGPWRSPVFSGHAHAENVAYGNLELDVTDGDISYSESGFSIARGRAQRGAMQADIEGQLALKRWSFMPDSAWSADVNFEKVPLGSLQGLLHKTYPVDGLLTGQFHGRGTRAEPSVTGLFDLAKGSAYGVPFDHLRGQLNVVPDEVRINTAELRIFPLGTENGRGAGIVTGNVAYRFADRNLSVDLVGAGLPLENFEKIQIPRLPVAGQLTFRVKASGPATAPSGEGSFRVVDLRIGQEVIGSFEGTLNSDGKEAKLEVSSAMTNGSVSGGYTVGLQDPYPIRGKIKIQNIKLDPFLQTALHLEHFAGHGTADGEISAEGNWRKLDTVVVDAKFTRLALEYANVQLQNEGPIHLRSSSSEFNLDPATLRGTDTNIRVGGNVRFTGRRTVNLDLNGALDLRLLSGYFPDVDARGPAQINASFEGTLDRPRITGRVHIDNASVRAVDTPLGLTAIKGDLIFDATRVFFENVNAEEGGGTLKLSGSLNYADRPIRYDITARTDRVRIRYPEGMSWLAGGTLRLTGTPDAGLVTGRVTVERVTLSGGLEVAGALIAAKEGISGPSTNSNFLRNLQFDVEAVSTPDARMEWPSAEFEADANLRVRGTWEHPILLGHIHVLSGDLSFRGNRYRVSRGDLNFANPFQLNPDINVEATTTIQQYEITLNFTGPANKLALSYRSDPPLPSNDIITLLALGQTTSEAELRGGGTGASQSSTAGASALLSEAISSQVGGRLERLFGITKLRVDPGLTGVGATGSEQNAAARVTVQQQIARDLTITYVSNVSSTQQQVIQVEYNVNRNVSIVALRDYNGTFGIDIKIKKRFP
jgi:translocation and assembly module TamB